MNNELLLLYSTGPHSTRAAWFRIKIPGVSGSRMLKPSLLVNLCWWAFLVHLEEPIVFLEVQRPPRILISIVRGWIHMDLRCLLCSQIFPIAYQLCEKRWLCSLPDLFFQQGLCFYAGEGLSVFSLCIIMRYICVVMNAVGEVLTCLTEVDALLNPCGE